MSGASERAGISHFAESALCCAVQLRMQIETTLLVLFDRNAMSIGPGILPDARHLPRDLHVRFIGLYGHIRRIRGV
jgi:hypothetical protein